MNTRTKQKREAMASLFLLYEYRVLSSAQNKEEAIWPPLILIQQFPAPVALRYRYHCRSIDRWHRIAAN